VPLEQDRSNEPASQAMFAHAQAAHHAGQYREAEHLYDEIIRLYPDHYDSLNQLAAIALQAGQAARGAGFIVRMIALRPDVAQAHANLGYALSVMRRFDEAERHYGRAVALQQNFTAAHYSRGVMLDALQRYEEAIASYDATIRLDPRYAAAYANRADALCDLNRLQEALASYDHAIVLTPGDARTHYNRANALYALGCHEEAAAGFATTVALNQTHPLAHNNLGVVLNELRKHDAAVSSFDQAIRLKPDYAEAHANRAVTLADARRYAEALASYDRAIALDPQFAKAHYGRGVALNELNRFEEALGSYARAWALAPDSPFLLGKLIHMKMAVCDWQGLDQLRVELADRIVRGEPATPPFQTLAIEHAPALHRRCAEVYTAATQPRTSTLPAIGKYPRREKIRLGYFSADLHDHATAILMAELFERHDRARFEITAFSFGPETNDPMRARLRTVFDRFVDVCDRTEKDIALLSRELEIDIAVDLKGHTGGARHRIFAWRAAPIQVNYLGYPGTMGAAFMDYLIADTTIISPGDRGHYCEKIVTLPDTYQPNDTKRHIAENRLTRHDAGLAEDAFVFCCFNNSYKITPDMFGLWMRILAQAESAVLWLLEDNPRVTANLRGEAQKQGIAPERLIFAPRTSHMAHLARHRLADLFLDTLPYNAHTTASDALWMGLPVLTQRGASFAGRVAASLLKALDLPDLVTETAGEYVQTAIDLARDPARLQTMRQRLAHNRRIAPLFDMARYTKAIEAAYGAMYERHHAGLPPDHISVESA